MELPLTPEEFRERLGIRRPTHFDRITASPESLAEFISTLMHDDICEAVHGCDYCPWRETDCCETEFLERDLWLKWLKQESDTK